MDTEQYILAQNTIISGLIKDVDALRSMMETIYREQLYLRSKICPRPPTMPNSKRPVSVPTKLPPVVVPRPPTAPRNSRRPVTSYKKKDPERQVMLF